MAGFIRCRNSRYSIHPFGSQRGLGRGYLATNVIEGSLAAA